MYDFMLNDNAIKWRNIARRFVKDEVPRQLVLDMDEDTIQYPREFVKNLAKNKLLGLRFPVEWGGAGLDNRSCRSGRNWSPFYGIRLCI